MAFDTEVPRDKEAEPVPSFMAALRLGSYSALPTTRNAGGNWRCAGFAQSQKGIAQSYMPEYFLTMRSNQ